MKKIINRIKYNFYYAYYGIQNYISKQIVDMYRYEQFTREAYTWAGYDAAMKAFSVDRLSFLQKTKYFFLSLINSMDIKTLGSLVDEIYGKSTVVGEYKSLEDQQNEALARLKDMSFLDKVSKYLTSFLSEEMVDICLDHHADNNFTADP